MNIKLFKPLFSITFSLFQFVLFVFQNISIPSLLFAFYANYFFDSIIAIVSLHFSLCTNSLRCIAIFPLG